jgi:hypothetical protein
VTEKGIPAGRHGDFEIAADASWLEHIDRAREASIRPSLGERPSATGKSRGKSKQLTLDLIRKAHLAFLMEGKADQSAAHNARMSGIISR